MFSRKQRRCPYLRPGDEMQSGALFYLRCQRFLGAATFVSDRNQRRIYRPRQSRTLRTDSHIREPHHINSPAKPPASL
jgi:hypothetical protein